jgi:hypothetical protein
MASFGYSISWFVEWIENAFKFCGKLIHFYNERISFLFYCEDGKRGAVSWLSLNAVEVKQTSHLLAVWKQLYYSCTFQYVHIYLYLIYAYRVRNNASFIIVNPFTMVQLFLWVSIFVNWKKKWQVVGYENVWIDCVSDENASDNANRKRF